MHYLAIIAALFATGAMADPADPARPIVLEAGQQGDDLVIRVVGRAASAVAASYAIEVSSGTTSSNRSVQRGRAALTPGREATLVNLRLAGAAQEDWRVKLTVEPEGGKHYTIERRGD